MIQAVLTALQAVLRALAAFLDRFIFDGIAVDTVPAMEGAFGLYRDAVRGLSVRIKVVNMKSAPIAIEWIGALLRLRPKRGGSNIRAAFGECWASSIEDGPRGSRLREQIYPIVVPGQGGESFLELHVAMQYYTRRIPLFPYYWKDVADVGIDEAEAPKDPEGHSIYDDYFDVRPVELRLQINGKLRTLLVGTRGWWGVLPRARLPGVMAPRTTQPPVPVPPRNDSSS